MAIKYLCDRCGKDCSERLFIKSSSRTSFDIDFKRRFLKGFTIIPIVYDESNQKSIDVNICQDCFASFTGINLEKDT